MILNTGSRTDIPAFYSEWFMRRIEAGTVCVRHPFQPKRVLRYQLDPSSVDVLAFCTKNPKPMLDHLDHLMRFNMFWGVSITPYDQTIEPYVPPVRQVVESFKQLSSKLGMKAVEWRYDPVFIDDKYTLDVHIKSFQWMASELSGYTEACVVSFIDLYQKTKRNFPSVRALSEDEQVALIKAFVKIGHHYGIRIKTCLENASLAQYGADVQGCMTQAVLEQALDIQLHFSKKTQARKGCDCLLGNDIGAYDSCPHACVYCYANQNKASVIRNVRLHNVDSPLLIGNLEVDDVIIDVHQKSNIDRQIRLFDIG